MIAQIFFSALLGIVFLYAWKEHRRSPAVAALSLITALAGLYFVWVPSQTTRLAEFVGIGRGVDLILYTWVAISLIVILNLHLKLRTQLEMITVLARAIALAGARGPQADAFGNPSTPSLTGPAAQWSKEVAAGSRLSGRPRV